MPSNDYDYDYEEKISRLPVLEAILSQVFDNFRFLQVIT